MVYQIQIRRDTAANWTSNNPTPAQGELCYETDTHKFKIGDGSTAWTSLSYWELYITALGAMAADLNMNSHKITGLSTPTSGTDGANKEYVDNLIYGLDWQESVVDQIDFTTSEPGSPTNGDRYINTATGTSSGTSQAVTANHIYEWNTVDWTDITPTEGYATWVEDENVLYVYNGSSWVKFGSTVTHNNLSGLNDGDYKHLTATEYTDTGDAISKKHTQNTDTGTTSSSFQVDSGSTGPRVKNSSGELQVRNSADDAFADAQVKDLYSEDLRTKDPGSSQNSYMLVLVANNSGTQQPSVIQGIYGATPYIRFSPSNGAGTSVAVMDLSTGNMSFVTDNSVDIGAAGANRPRNVYAAGNGVFGGYMSIAGAQYVNTTTVNAATYDLLTTDYILDVTYTGTGAVTSLTLPTAQCTDGRIVIVFDAGGSAGTNNITIDTEGSEKINGEDTYIINGDYDAITIQSDGSNWFVVQKISSSLDGGDST